MTTPNTHPEWTPITQALDEWWEQDAPVALDVKTAMINVTVRALPLRQRVLYDALKRARQAVSRERTPGALKAMHHIRRQLLEMESDPDRKAALRTLVREVVS